MAGGVVRDQAELVRALAMRSGGSWTGDVDTIVLVPPAQGWPLAVHVGSDDATVLCPLGARLRVGRDSDSGPLEDVVAAILSGDAEVSVVRRADGTVGSAWRVWWGSNVLGNIADPGDVVVATVRAPRWQGGSVA